MGGRRGALTLTTDGTLQARRVTQGHTVRRATIGRTITIPGTEPGDIDLITSELVNTDLQYPWGLLHEADGEVFFIGSDRWLGRVHNVTRAGDAFAMDFESHPVYLPPITTGTPDGRSLRNGSFLYLRNTTAVIPLDNNVVIVQCLVEDRNHPSVRPLWNEFQAVHLDPGTGTGRWGESHRVLAPDTQFSTTTGTDFAQYRGCALDGSHFVIGGSNSNVNGWQPWMWMVHYDHLTDKYTKWGPFLYGGKTSEAGLHPTCQSNLIRLDDTRLLAVWMSRNELNLSSIPANVHHRNLLHTQMFTYDTTAHTITPVGPMRRFESGIEQSSMHTVYYPSSGVLLFVGIAWDSIVGAHAVGDEVGDENISARTLLISGTDITEGHSRKRVVTAGRTLTDWEDFWYSCAVIHAGDRVAVIYPDIGYNLGGLPEGNLYYTKLRIGQTGAERGAIQITDDGVLFDGSASTHGGPYGELYANIPHVTPLPDGSNLTYFEHYRDDWFYTVFRTVLAREVT